jgi:hypothetical protein
MSFGSVLRWGGLGLLAGILVGVCTNDFLMPAFVRWQWFEAAAFVAGWGPIPIGVILMFVLAVRSTGNPRMLAVAGVAFTIGTIVTANDGSSYPLNFYMMLAIALVGAPVTLLALLAAFGAATAVKRYIPKSHTT